MGFYGQGNTAVYFTFSAPLLIHYSKRSIKIATKKARGLFLFLLLCQILYSRAHPLYKKKGSFIAEKDNKLSGVLQHLLLDDIIHSRGLQCFFISWTPRLYRSSSGDRHRLHGIISYSYHPRLLAVLAIYYYNRHSY